MPERAEYIRVILCELNRIASHMLFYGVYGLDAGAMTPILYGFRERERVQALFESVTGARMMHNYIRIGGVNEDLPDDFAPRMDTLIDQLERGIEECDRVLSQNEMFLARTKGIGAITAAGSDRLGRDGSRAQSLRASPRTSAYQSRTPSMTGSTSASRSAHTATAGTDTTSA